MFAFWSCNNGPNGRWRIPLSIKPSTFQDIEAGWMLKRSRKATRGIRECGGKRGSTGFDRQPQPQRQNGSGGLKAFGRMRWGPHGRRQLPDGARFACIDVLLDGWRGWGAFLNCLGIFGCSAGLTLVSSLSVLPSAVSGVSIRDFGRVESLCSMTCTMRSSTVFSQH